MMLFIWSCMVLAFKVMIGGIFWSLAVTLLGIVGALIGLAISTMFSQKGPSVQDRKEDEDPEEWLKDQMRDKDKWGNL